MASGNKNEYLLSVVRTISAENLVVWEELGKMSRCVCGDKTRSAKHDLLLTKLFMCPNLTTP